MNTSVVPRNGVTQHRFDDLATAIEKPEPETLVLDGEIAVFDDQLVSRFQLLAFEVFPGSTTRTSAGCRSTPVPIPKDAADGAELVLPARRAQRRARSLAIPVSTS